METFKKFCSELNKSELIKWNPTIGFMSNEDLLNLVNDDVIKGNVHNLPMHGMNIMWVDNYIKKIVTEFNPKYVVYFREESFMEYCGYPKCELLYDYKSNHEIHNLYGVPTKIKRFKIRDHYGLMICQGSPGSNMSFILLKEIDYMLAKLTNIDICKLIDDKNNLEVFESIKFFYRNCFGLEFHN